ncbi:MAG: zinc-ribbon domain-containing protein [Candidatus Krumholzibacteria bacterium]|nr:zinc-ribbon domain-containing protein [Candidatus Krumholzibacteria bacterium]
MITTCTVCQARYQLDDEKIPARVIKVRCPACSGVFSLDGTQARREEPLVTSGFEPVHNEPQPDPAPAPPASVPEAPAVESPAPSTPAPSVSAPSVPAPAFERDVAPVASAPAASASIDTGAPSVAVMDEPAPAPATSSRRRRSKEEMLARALVSDIKVYNRELYDTAKAEGNLLEALGAEIKKSWELYKEKVTPEVANSTDHFRDALNEILADGEKVF